MHVKIKIYKQNITQTFKRSISVYLIYLNLVKKLDRTYLHIKYKKNKAFC